MSLIKHKIYLDMDGVIADWVTQFKNYSKGMAPEEYENKYGKTNRYLFVKKYSPDFYGKMPKMVDADVLLNYLKNFDVDILSHSTDPEASEGKLSWLDHYKINYTPILVNNSEDKSNFATPDSILIDDKPENVKEFREAGGLAILHKSAEQTIRELQKLQSSYINEASYRLYNSILNPDIWNADATIKDDVADSLMNIANSFYKDTELTVPIEDVYLLGSVASYNWTPTSDLDIHLVVDFDKISENSELVDAYANLLKSKWNTEHDIKVKNHPVEVYLQDIGHKTHASGVYSLKNKEWIKKPEYDVPKIDKSVIKKKYKELVKVIDDSVKAEDLDKITKLVKKIYDYRQSGLDKNGEFSVENIVFKLLRATGYIEKLKLSANKIKDKELSNL